MARRRGVAALLAAVVAALALQLPTSDLAAAPRRPAPSPPQVTGEDGLRFRLSEAGAETGASATPPTSPAPATPLSDADADRLLSRLPPPSPEPGDVRDWAIREKSLPPPRAGALVRTPFPPPERPAAGPPDVEKGPLRVVRRSPEGNVPMAPHLSVSFSQPMVAVTSHEDTLAAGVPVRIDPLPPGRWRWVGTKTLLFEPEPRFPMATTYTVQVPAGTRSATGGVLASGEQWTFRTPPPSVTESWPRDIPVRRRPVLIAVFDQKVDPAAVLATVELVATGRTFPVRLASAEEIRSEEEVARRAKAAVEGYAVAFVPQEDLPPDTAVHVAIGPGTPSAEGPLRTEKELAWGFQTYGRLKVLSHNCGWGGVCRPLMPWHIQLSNPIDAALFKPEMVRVTPALPAMQVDVHGNQLVVRGRSKGRTPYRVTLGADLPDTFGQTLGEPATVAFEVGPAEPSLSAPGGDFVVLDPAARPRFSVFTINQRALRVTVHAVGPEHWDAFRKYRQERYRDRRLPPLPGRAVFTRTVPVAAAPDELTETAIDLSPALPDGTGQLLLLVEPVAAQVTEDSSATSSTARAARPPVRFVAPLSAWVQATRLGLHAMVDNHEVIAWTSALADGRPLSDVRVRLLPGGSEATTGADGLIRLPLTNLPASLLVAQSGRDLAILPDDAAWWSDEGSWREMHRGGVHRFFVFDDRHLYRPGETVKVKGYLRSVGLDEAGDVDPWTGNVIQSVAWFLKDSQGNDVAKGTAPVNQFGAFDLSTALPATMNLGTAQILVRARDTKGNELHGHEHHHGLEVQEFRRPEFEVDVQAEPGPHLIGAHSVVTATASYFAGGSLGASEVTWNAAASPGSFRPPNRDEYTFGTWIPWWIPWSGAKPNGKTETLTARTDAAGRHRLRVDLDGVSPPRPSTLRVEATIMDVNRQAWTDGVDLLVHPASIYVGLKTERPFVGRGEPLKVDALVVDLEGKAVAGQAMAMVAERLEWKRVGTEWKETAAESAPCSVTSAEDAVACTFRPGEGGSWRITARVTDEKDRPNESQLRVWVAGDTAAPSRGVEQQSVTLVPDKKEYRAGDTARVLVVAPFAPAEAVMSLRRSGVVKTQRFRMDGATHTLTIPIEEAWTPNVHVQVDLAGRAGRAPEGAAPAVKGLWRPAFASGILSLPIPPLTRTLAVAATPRDAALEPGGKTTVDLVVKDAGGRPLAGAEVALVVVDEAVLSLTGYKLPDPVAAFYAQREPGARDQELRRSLVLARPDDLSVDPETRDELKALGYLNGVEGGVAGGVVGGLPDGFAAQGAPAAPPALMRAKRVGGVMEQVSVAAEAAPIRARVDWAALAHFAPSVITDPSGRAQVPITVPDNLTRYRIMAVAATTGREFGKGESVLTARLPLMVRASPPRFLNDGDRFELPIVVQNQTGQAMTVDVAVRATNASIVGPRGQRVTVPADERVEVRFPAAAARPGTARFQIAAASGRFSDASEHALPVWTPATTEAFAAYGVVDRGAVVQPVKAPSDAIPDYGGLEVTTTSTALATLTDAVLYLVAYPFECTEQLSSRILGVAGLRDVLAAFSAKGLPEPKALQDSMTRDIALLRRLQNDDGGWPFWRRGDESWPYVSIHVAHALQRAKEKGYPVPDETLKQALEYLKSIESHYPSWYGPDVRRTLTAYALYVRQRMGSPDPARARSLLREAGLEKLRMEAIGWLLPVLARDAGSAATVLEIRRHLGNRAVETGATAHFVDDYGDQGPHVLLHSDRRADAVILEALIGDQPQSDLIPKLVEGLLGHRRKGRWENTQENAFVLLALDRYFQTYEKTTPDFVARLWLGDTFAGEHAFRGRSADRQHVDIPMRVVAAQGGTELTIAKEGAGRLYYRIGMQYAPNDRKVDPADHGFTVERIYEAVDDPRDVRRDADGTWRIRAGARVRVRVTMVTTSRRYHVALVDPLPAGLEPLNPELATTGRLTPESGQTVDEEGGAGLGLPGHWWWWRRVWYEHENLRDERVEAFASLVWEGAWTYRYQARATTPGRFVVPPPKAEEMYHPETFGRGGSAVVIVE